MAANWWPHSIASIREILFDVMQLFAHEGITPAVRRAFVVYLACHNRPVHEVLFPKLRDLQRDEWWPGTESNHRHPDFSPNETLRTPNDFW